MPAGGKLQYNIVFCSSEDPEHPATELYIHNHTTKGWQSSKSRSTPWPQEMGLQFDTAVDIQKIQFLSHQYKIPSTIELFVGNPSLDSPYPEYGRSEYKRLGYLSLDDNQKTEYKARELKSVHIRTTGTFLKIFFHKPHPNVLNTFNQVGIIAINILGEPSAAPAPPIPAALPYSNPQSQPQPQHQNQNQAPTAQQRMSTASMSSTLASSAGSTSSGSSASSVDGSVDPVTAQKIYILSVAKDDAVRVENYELAKHLKDLITFLKRVGADIGKVEQSKRMAVECEDYETAAILKKEIEQMRASAYNNVPDIPDLMASYQQTPSPTDMLPPPRGSNPSRMSTDLSRMSTDQLNSYYAQELIQHQQQLQQQAQQLQQQQARGDVYASSDAKALPAGHRRSGSVDRPIPTLAKRENSEAMSAAPTLPKPPMVNYEDRPLPTSKSSTNFQELNGDYTTISKPPSRRDRSGAPEKSQGSANVSVADPNEPPPLPVEAMGFVPVSF